MRFLRVEVRRGRPTQPHSPAHHQRKHSHRNWATAATALFNHGDALVYILVGLCFFAAALLSLGYAVIKFGDSLVQGLSRPHLVLHLGTADPQTIVNFVSDLLLTLIIMEVLGTVVHYLRTRETSLRPFLFIGIISATRSILAVGARLSISDNGIPPAAEFRTSMITLAVNAAVIVALGITMRMIGNLLDDSFDGPDVTNQVATKSVSESIGTRQAQPAECGQTAVYSESNDPGYTAVDGA